jgi:hypothetical protein
MVGPPDGSKAPAQNPAELFGAEQHGEYGTLSDSVFWETVGYRIGHGFLLFRVRLLLWDQPRRASREYGISRTGQAGAELVLLRKC